MKKIIIFLFGILIITQMIFPGEKINLLRIPEPGSAMIKKNQVLVHLDDIKTIIKNAEMSQNNINVELATSSNYVVARLAKIKNNRSNWQHKVIDGRFLLVDFGKNEYEELLRRVLHKQGSLNYQIIFSDKENKILKNFPVTFSKLPDLSAVLKYPVNILPGNPIHDKMTIIVKNNGMEPSVESEVELLLSKKFNIPKDFRKAIESKDLITFKNGKIKIPVLKPGEERELKPTNEIIVPTNISEGKYYLAAITDPDDNLVELDEGNNLFEGFVIVETFEPKKITLTFPNTELVYYPSNFKLEIVSNGMVISSGREWRKCNIKPYIFQIKHASWINFFWEIDTIDRSVWKITGAKFCKRGGTEKPVKAKVINFGGTKVIPPSKFKILLKDTEFIYAPKLRKLVIKSQNDQIGHPSFWQICKIKPLKYHIRFKEWTTDFLQLDPATKTVQKFPLGFMCKTAKNGKETKITVKIEN